MKANTFIAATILFLTGPILKASSLESLPMQLDALVQAEFNNQQVAGLNVAVTWKGKTLLNKGYGQSNIEAKTSADESTVYSIGSMTKQFTAVAILQLAQKGLLSLDEDVHDLVPEYPARQPPETVRTLLSHTSGIPDYFPEDNTDQSSAFRPISKTDLIARFSHAPLDFLPATNFAYSNSNFYLLGVAIERLTGESYNSYLRQNIFVPLGLDIDECGSAAFKNRMAQGYERGNDGAFTATPDLDLSWAFSAGNLCATASAIIRWNELLHRGHLLFSQEYSFMTTPAIMSDGTPTTYGAGLFVDTFEGHRHFEHAGDTETFHGQGAYYPDDELSIVILTNTNSSFDRYGLERSLGRAVLALPTSVPVSLPLPLDLGAKVVGNYEVLGRSVFAANPLQIAAENNQVTLMVQGRSIPLTYIGNGRFVVGSANSAVFLVFPNSENAAPFFSVVVHEMLVARGMRISSSIARDRNYNLRIKGSGKSAQLDL